MTTPQKKLVEMLGNRCVICKESDTDILHLDHVFDDGSKDRVRFKTNIALYHYYLKHPDEAKRNLQVLCANHNWKKRYQKHITSSMKEEEIKKEPEPPSPYFSFFEWVRDGDDRILVWKHNQDRPRPNAIGCSCGSKGNWTLASNSQKLDGVIFLHCDECGHTIEIHFERILLGEKLVIRAIPNDQIPEMTI